MRTNRSKDKGQKENQREKDKSQGNLSNRVE
jgi:hypothetical protein